MLYKLLKWAYTAMWFYGAPFLATLLQFWLIDSQLEVVNRQAEDLRRDELLKQATDGQLLR